MQKIIFNAQFTNDHSRIESLSGRLGNFIFRTDSKTGQISAFYKPKKTVFPQLHRVNIESPSRLHRD